MVGGVMGVSIAEVLWSKRDVDDINNRGPIILDHIFEKYSIAAQSADGKAKL